MIVRAASRGVLAYAAAWALRSTSLPGVYSAPVVVTDFAGLVGTIGSTNEYDTGERFAR